jgi:ribosomal protein L24E
MANKRDSDFSLRALYEALDAQRQARGLSWSQATKEMHHAPKSNRTRPLSQSTVTGMRTKALAEGDGVLAMLRWLNRTPESFVPGHPGSEEISARLPDVPPGKILRFDTRKIHAALDARRIERKMTWAQVAKEAGTGASTLMYLSKGTRVAFPGVMRIFRWLDRPAAGFTRASDR